MISSLARLLCNCLCQGLVTITEPPPCLGRHIFLGKTKTFMSSNFSFKLADFNYSFILVTLQFKHIIASNDYLTVTGIFSGNQN